jgi:hypothetical protein
MRDLLKCGRVPTTPNWMTRAPKEARASFLTASTMQFEDIEQLGPSDVVFIASDGARFDVHINYLSLASPVFAYVMRSER